MSQLFSNHKLTHSWFRFFFLQNRKKIVRFVNEKCTWIRIRFWWAKKKEKTITNGITHNWLVKCSASVTIILQLSNVSPKMLTYLILFCLFILMHVAIWWRHFSFSGVSLSIHQCIERARSIRFFSLKLFAIFIKLMQNCILHLIFFPSSMCVCVCFRCK